MSLSLCYLAYGNLLPSKASTNLLCFLVRLTMPSELPKSETENEEVGRKTTQEVSAVAQD
jgi:hypothetical protein